MVPEKRDSTSQMSNCVKVSFTKLAFLFALVASFALGLIRTNGASSMPLMYFPFDPGLALAAFPVSRHDDLDDFASIAIEATEGTGADAGRYAFEIPDDADRFYAVFVGVPDSFTRSIGMLVAQPLDGGSERVYFTQPVGGLDLLALPATSSLGDLEADSAVVAGIVDGLYSVTLNRSASNTKWFIFERSDTPRWVDYLGIIDLVVYGTVVPPVGPGTTGIVQNLLSVDYEDDWQYLDGIESCGYEFSDNRTTSLVAPAAGVRAKRGSPNQTDIIGAASEFGYDSHDCIFVVWSSTLIALNNGKVINVRNGDVIKDSFGVRWVIKSHKRTQDFAQWRCYCKRSTKEVVDYDGAT